MAQIMLMLATSLKPTACQDTPLPLDGPLAGGTLCDQTRTMSRTATARGCNSQHPTVRFPETVEPTPLEHEETTFCLQPKDGIFHEVMNSLNDHAFKELPVRAQFHGPCVAHRAQYLARAGGRASNFKYKL
eukprot:2531941-Rhodomonas_salina.2